MAVQLSLPWFAWKNLDRRRLRTGLTLGGIAMAIGAFVALVGFSNSFEHEWLRIYENGGTDGERQRVAIAPALANNPSILLADEPTGNLDSANSVRIMEMLTGIQSKRGMTLIVVTHENEIANSAPRHIRIRDGRIESDCVASSASGQHLIGQERSKA